MSGEPRRASRRDLFRLLGRSLAEFAGETRPAEAVREAARAFADAGGAGAAERAVPSAPSTPVPVQGGRLAVDLAVHPVPVHRGRRFVGDDGSPPVLVVRVHEEHFAAVDADCPRCGRALEFDLPADAVLCPSGDGGFRMDGRPLRGADGPRLRSLPCRRAGPRLEVG